MFGQLSTNEDMGGFKPYLCSLITAGNIITMGTDFLPEYILTNYEVHEWKHACVR
jgi:hypothetical protein